MYSIYFGKTGNLGICIDKDGYLYLCFFKKSTLNLPLFKELKSDVILLGTICGNYENVLSHFF